MGGSESSDHESPLDRALTIRPEAEAEILDAYWWYETQSEGLGAEFLRSVEASLASIQRHPTSFPSVHKGVRRAVLRRFPYCILYVIEDGVIAVLACFHAARDPKEWYRRV